MAARSIRAAEQQKQHPPQRIVTLSANSFAEDRQAALEASVAFL
jgi:CheY-like chemotaxis protein